MSTFLTNLLPSEKFYLEIFKGLIQFLSTATVSYFVFYKQNNKADKEKSYEPIIALLFQPFHFPLERNLFHKPIPSTEIASLKEKLNLTREKRSHNNISFLKSLKLNNEISNLKNSLNRSVDLKKLYKTLKNLKKKIIQNNLEFYLSDPFLYYLDRMIVIIEDLNSVNPSSKDLENLYYYFKRFSSQYLQELQNARKAVGLKKRTLGYRQNFGLYANKPLFYTKIYGFPIAIAILTWLIEYSLWTAN